VGGDPGALVNEGVALRGCAAIVDDAALTCWRKHSLDRAMARRMRALFTAVTEGGADVILGACTPVGDAADIAARIVNVPIVKTDEPVAERAAMIGGRVGVVATVENAIEPALARVRQLLGP